MNHLYWSRHFPPPIADNSDLDYYISRGFPSVDLHVYMGGHARGHTKSLIGHVYTLARI